MYRQGRLSLLLMPVRGYIIQTPASPGDLRSSQISGSISFFTCLITRNVILEPLEGKRKGEYSIRVNDQWRICFVWRNGNAYDVEIVDYHR